MTTDDPIHEDNIGYYSDPAVRAHVDQRIAGVNTSLDALIVAMQEHYAKHREHDLEITPLCGDRRFLAWMEIADASTIKAHLHLALYRLAQGIVFHIEPKGGDADG